MLRKRDWVGWQRDRKRPFYLSSEQNQSGRLETDEARNQKPQSLNYLPKKSWFYSLEFFQITSAGAGLCVFSAHPASRLLSSAYAGALWIWRRMVGAKPPTVTWYLWKLDQSIEQVHKGRTAKPIFSFLHVCSQCWDLYPVKGLRQRLFWQLRLLNTHTNVLINKHVRRQCHFVISTAVQKMSRIFIYLRWRVGFRGTFFGSVLAVDYCSVRATG